MEKIIHPTYFPSIKIFSELVKIDELLFEVNDNYQKQINIKNHNYQT